MKKDMDIKKELEKLKIKYEKEKLKIIEKCNHNWIDSGYQSNKYNGTQYYRCSICESTKGTGY